MKTSKLLLLTGIVFLMSFDVLSPGITDAERKRAVDLLSDSRDNLLKKVKGLSTEQLNFKASPESWSIAECVEHLALSENNIFGMYQSGMKVAADPSKRSEVKMTDDAVVGLIIDRTNKIKTSEMFVPSNKFGSYDATLKEFTVKRNNSINYVKTTTDDMRNHYNDLPFGKIDTYQTILFMAGHSKRHTAQIDEVMTNTNYPKK